MIRMRFEGGAELAQALAQRSMRLGKKVLHEALREGAAVIQKSASAKAPVGSEAPHLRSNIGIANARPGDAMAAVAIGPVKGFAYGLPQEVGTVNHPAQPFMRPAFDIDGPHALEVIGQAAWRELAGKGIGRTSTISVPIQSEGPLL